MVRWRPAIPVLVVAALLSQARADEPPSEAPAAAPAARLEEIAVLRGHTQLVRTLAFAPDRPHVLVSGGSDRSLRYWDVRTKKPLHEVVLPRGG